MLVSSVAAADAALSAGTGVSTTGPAVATSATGGELPVATRTASPAVAAVAAKSDEALVAATGGPATPAEAAVATSSRQAPPAGPIKSRAGYCPGCAGSTTTAAPAVAAVAA